MIRKRPEKDTVTPPGQIVTPVPDPITEHNIREWKKWEESRTKVLHDHVNPDGTEMVPNNRHWVPCVCATGTAINRCSGFWSDDEEKCPYYP